MKILSISDLKALEKHHDLYVELYVLLSADVFENIRKARFKYYGFHICHNIWQEHHGMLKMTEVESQFFLMLMRVYLLRQESV